ncbi:FAD-dependent oxidoreductase [Antrihabitans cavernicola]|uniref:ferredoxin--NADP(+) reductase n=1 Tax=Antrihabitans cavernicola TaxID=2495913 RepID=A0A5A7S208_9NOCA|nr:FAD-dependent oxidoreductase [Spelaeibacter cavernicola]KAA0017687.1 4Fe-4S ferredoxin [Spelaeibacter cavernicola]
MPHVVTQSCCSDASCVYACPVNCIHPTPDEPDFLTAEMLHIDPASCVDCGACVSACPVDAIVPQSKLTDSQQRYLGINADFYREPRQRPLLAPVTPPPAARQDVAALRVAIVGSGPAAMYAADELLTQPDVQVNVFDRLPTPHGLVRAGVAPDHQHTKQVSELFETIADQPGFEYYLNVEVGTDLTHQDLLEHHHAVIYAVGASSDRRLNISGVDLPGCASATDFVAWYNGHPDHAHHPFDLSHPRAVIIGNGNVALDVARILTADPDQLAATDIAAPALEALRNSRIEEVVIVGRRGVAQSAFTVPEFAGLLAVPNLRVRLDPAHFELDEVTARRERDGSLDHSVVQKLRMLRELSTRDSATPGRKQITLRYLSAPKRIVGEDHVAGVELVATSLVLGDDGVLRAKPTGHAETLDAGLVLTSIGYRGIPVTGLPFDEAGGVVPNSDGRVLDRVDGDRVPGTYVAGWIKRGPTGYIGTNKSCAQETVNALVDDFNCGLLTAPTTKASALKRFVSRRQPAVVDRAGWQAIDRVELQRGAVQHRVRDKIVDRAEMVTLAAARPHRLLRLSPLHRVRK